MDFQFDLKNVKWFRDRYNNPEAYIKIKTPSVSGVINDMIPDPGIEKWIEEVGKERADEITKASHQRGTAMHVFIEEYLKSYKDSRDPSKALKHTQLQSPLLLEKEGIPKQKIDIGRDLFYNFYESEYANSFLELIGTELPIYSPFLFFRGKADIVYKRSGITLTNSLSITDFKTANSYIEKGSVKEIKYKLQLGAYSLALDDMYVDKGIKSNYASIISMHTKSSMIQVIECFEDELEVKKEEFKTIVKNWHKKNNQWMIFN